jgi:CBS domain-containing protein
VLGWLGYINLALAAFNMIPGYPLDGGRVLRAVLWRASGSMERATRQAARVGQAVGLGMIFFGMLRAFSGAGFGGLWIAFIGWFLLQAAQSSYAHVVILDRLRGIHVSDVMIHHPVAVSTHATLRAVADDLRQTGARSAAVTMDGEIVGIVTVREIAAVPRDQWPQRVVGDVMRPLERGQTLSPAAPASDAFELMARGTVADVPVVDHNHLEGMVTRSHLLEVLRTRAELEH